MLQELCIGELQDDREAHARRESRKLERRSLLLMQSPVMDKLYAERRRQQQQLQHDRNVGTWAKRGATAAAGAVVAVALLAMIYT